MKRRFTLRARIIVLVSALVVTNLSGALLTLWYSHRNQQLSASMLDRDINTLMIAQQLETHLVMQKGFVTYYFLTGDEDWLKQLSEHNLAFERDVQRARDSAYLDEARTILNNIESAYIRFVYARDQVIDLYKAGRRDDGAKLHWKVRDQFYTIYELCENYKRIHEQSIARARADYQRRSRMLTSFAWGAIPVATLLGLVLAYVFLRQVLDPIRQLALGPEPAEPPATLSVGDEMTALSRRVHSLMEDRDQAQSQLEASREHLIHSEKLALVGKLAAGVAHSIRNPLTSVKMRLFSLERSLGLDATQKEDFDVISEEIRYIDTILRNFLEFSRPPKLKIQRVSPSDVVDMTLQLLRSRLESYGVEIQIERERRLPKVNADSEQLKEVLVNLILNACEAMGGGGVIKIHEEEGVVDPLGQVVVLRVSDNGPGIPKGIQDKVFEPFFSSKEEGSGLGLSIARRIVEMHGGWLALRSTEGQGASFVITLPAKETTTWPRS